MLVERIGAGHLRYRVDRKTGVGEVGRLQRRVSHSQECSSTSGARVSHRKRFWKNWSPFRCSPFWLPTTDRRCSTLPAQGRRAPRVEGTRCATSDPTDMGTEKTTKAPEGTAAGVTAGGVIGGTLGLLAGVGMLAVPGLAPFIPLCFPFAMTLLLVPQNHIHFPAD